MPKVISKFMQVLFNTVNALSS